MPTDHAAAARRAKAIKIADHLWGLAAPNLRTWVGFPLSVAGFLPEQRLAAAKAAGAHAKSRPDDLPPSDETWEIVVFRITVKVRNARERVAIHGIDAMRAATAAGRRRAG